MSHDQPATPTAHAVHALLFTTLAAAAGYLLAQSTAPLPGRVLLGALVGFLAGHATRSLILARSAAARRDLILARSRNTRRALPGRRTR